MAIIMPFRGVRPARGKAGLVSSNSFESYREEELRLQLAQNEFSFLQIINPDYSKEDTATKKGRYGPVRERYEQFLKKGILIKDPYPCLYLYELRKEQEHYMGVVCAVSTDDYRTNVIRRHEDTILKRERIFARYLEQVHFNAEPVLLTYPDSPDIEAILRQEQAKKPECDFKTADGFSHRLWPVRDANTIAQIQSLFKHIERIYIADGHHRAASSYLMAAQTRTVNEAHTGKEAYNYFMSLLLPESAIRISTFNRMVRDLNGHTIADFLNRLDSHFEVGYLGQHPCKPLQIHTFSMYLEGGFYLLRLRKNRWKITDPLTGLDSFILSSTILKPVLGIADLRNSKRIEYLHRPGSLMGMKQQIDDGTCAVGFDMAAVTIEQLKAIADAGQVMPPKSTYIEPKLRSALTIYEF